MDEFNELLDAPESAGTPPSRSASESVDASELIELCAADPDFFAKQFFPNTIRQESPPFHKDVDMKLESSARLVNIQMFRGSGKTTKLRMFMAKRIAYGISRTIMYVGLSQDKAIQSVSWLRSQIETNRKFAETYQLVPGQKWTDVECKIKHKLFGHTVTILAYGISGSIRGVNIDDYRPDLIIVDDIIDEENAASAEQRDKTERLLYGALINSLAPSSESPDAMLAMLQTPLNKEDASTKALTNPAWVSARYGCWTKETEHFPDTQKESAWQVRFPTQELRADKTNAIRMNKTSIFLREMECKITAPETSAFRGEWLNYYIAPPEREHMWIIGAIDPVPPPTENELAKGLHKKDFETLAIVGTVGGNYYLLEYRSNRGHDPSWTTAQFFELSFKWRPSQWIVETVGYQKTLQWILKKEMRDRGIYYPTQELKDNRSKYQRIVDGLNGPASNGALWVNRNHYEFIDQFITYPDTVNDDVLDCVSMAMLKLPLLATTSRSQYETANSDHPINQSAARKPVGVGRDSDPHRVINRTIQRVGAP